jgi:hypothetical protein
LQTRLAERLTVAFADPALAGDDAAILAFSNRPPRKPIRSCGAKAFWRVTF